MPNLKHLQHLREVYGESENNLTKGVISDLLEGFNPIPKSLTKAFTFTEDSIKEYKDYFKKRKKVDVVLLFIDATSFSRRFKDKPSDEIATFLDDYYEKVIPEIYKYGGEVEKIIGDGIICVFGEPFLKLSMAQLHRRAEKCSMKIISKLIGTQYESKIALHYGEIMYYQNKSNEYYDFTMVGNALTDLFRLEHISENNGINFYCPSFYESLNILDVRMETKFSSAIEWTVEKRETVDLKGVNYKAKRMLKGRK